MTTRRYVSPSLAATLGVYERDLADHHAGPWLEPLALMALIGILWRAVHPRAPQPYDPARQSAAANARLTRWFTIG